MEVVFAAILMSVNFMSCSNDNDVIIPEQHPELQESEYITVKLGCTGEFLQLEESFMTTRANENTKDLIGIQVFAMDTTAIESETNGYEIPYAYGLFTSLENVSIKLRAGEKYKLIASIVVDACKCEGEHTCGHSEDYDNSNSIFNTPISTEFTYSDSWIIHGNHGMSYYYDYDYFYGELEGYIPEKNGTANIETIRTAYGVHYIVENMDEGYLSINYELRSWAWGGERHDYTETITSNNPELNRIYMLRYPYEAWKAWKYGETDPYNPQPYNLTINWTKNDGNVIELGTFPIAFKRNVKTTVRIDMAELANFKNGITVTQTEEWVNDENEYLITGDGIEEIPVVQE